MVCCSQSGKRLSRPAQLVASLSYKKTPNLSNVGRGRHVTTATGPVDVNVLVDGEVVAGVLGLDAEGVGTEVVTLGLQQVGGEVPGTVAVVEAEGSAEGRERDTQEGSLADNVPPAALGVVNGLGEELVEQKVVEVGVGAVSVGDVLQEDGADDAATTPHEGDGRIVKLPAVLLGSLPDEHEALRVGDDLGSIETLLQILDESLLVTRELSSGRAIEDGASADTLVLEGTQATGEDCLANKSDRHAQVKGVDGSPFAGTLLAGLVKDLVDERKTVVVVVVEDITGDLDQERVEDTFVPLSEDIGDLLGREAQTALEEVIRLKRWLVIKTWMK